MGKVYLDGTEVGSCDTQLVGSSGNVLCGTNVVGTFNFEAVSGLAYIDSTVIGSFDGMQQIIVSIGFIQPTVIQPNLVQPIVIHG
jgi:hypothetical protein